MIKRLLISTLLLILVAANTYSGGPDYDIDNVAKNVSSSGEFFLAGGLGVAKGPYSVNVNSKLFPAASFGGGAELAQTSYSYYLINKGSLLYTLEIGYNFDQYVGLYFAYNDWGQQPIARISVITSPGVAQDFPGVLKSRSFGPGIIGYMPVDEGLFDFFGAVDVEFVTSNMNFALSNSTFLDFVAGSYSVIASNQIALVFSLGGQVNIGKYFSVRLGVRSMTRLGNTDIGNIYYNAYFTEAVFRYSI